MTGFTPIDPPSANSVGRGRAPDDRADAELYGPVVVNLADVQPEPVHWLWPGRFALGKPTLLAGDPGLGKSFLTLDMAARITTGTPWPDAPHTPNEPGGVVLLSAEDDAADTIRPRLDAASADVQRVNLIRAVRVRPPYDSERQQPPGPVEATFDLTRDLPALESTIEATADCRLVVIDPISAYLGKTDSHNNADLRGVLTPLADLASRHRVAVLAVTHLNKSASGPAIYRSTGSLAFIAAARAAWLVTKDKDSPRRRLLLPLKNNLAADVLGLAYAIETTEHGDAVVAWEADPVELSADDALGDDGRKGGAGAATDEAMEWLRDFLATGPRPAKEVKERAEADGIALRTLDRAKKRLEIESRRDGKPWVWRLPDGQVRQERQHPADGNLGDLDGQQRWDEL